MKVFLLTEISDLIYDEILESPGCMLLSPFAHISSQVQAATGILCHMVNNTKTMTQEEIDVAFAEQYMPGSLEGLTLEGDLQVMEEITKNLNMATSEETVGHGFAPFIKKYSVNYG